MRGTVHVRPRGWVRVMVAGARVLVGHHAHGRKLTDAGWFVGAYEGLDGHRPTRWTRLPHAHRAAVVWSGLGVLLLLAWGLWSDRIAMVTTLRFLFWTLFLYGWYLTVRVCRKRGWYHGKYVPLARSIGPMVGWSRHLHPRTWLTIPLTYATDRETPVVVTLPPEFRATEPMRRRIVTHAADRLSLRAPDFAFELTEVPAQLVLRCRPAPPELVTFAELLPLLADRKPGEIVLGKAPRGVGFVVNLRGEQPHMALSVTTGGGKSITASVIAMQVLHDGGNALILDPKIISLPWARGLDAVRYCSDIPDIHDALVWLAGEIQRRMEVISATADEDGNVDITAVGAPLLVVLEEVNTLVPDLVDYWRSIKQRGESQVSPAISAIRRALAMGRGGQVHVLGIAQYLTAAAIGGPAARQNFSTRILMKPNPAVWNLLGGTEYKVNGKWPESTGAAGRAHILQNGIAEECQIAWPAPREAKAYATSGAVVPFAGTVPPVPPGGDTFTGGGDTGTRHLRVLSAPPAVVLSTLKDAADAGDLGVGYEAAKKTRYRYRESFPVMQGATNTGAELYDRDELRAWFRDRQEGTS